MEKTMLLNALKLATFLVPWIGEGGLLTQPFYHRFATNCALVVVVGLCVSWS